MAARSEYRALSQRQQHSFVDSQHLWNSPPYRQSHGQGLGTPRSYSPHPTDRVPVPALFSPDFRILNNNLTLVQKEAPTLFLELMPLLRQRTLLITVARIDEKLKVNVIPAKAKEGEDEALTTPLSYTGSPEELDRELGQHLASYVDSHVALGSTLAEAKAEMDAAAKAARQKVKTAQQTSKPDTATRKEESAPPVAAPADTTPSLFAAQTQTEKSGTETSAPERSTP